MGKGLEAGSLKKNFIFLRLPLHISTINHLKLNNGQRKVKGEVLNSERQKITKEFGQGYLSSALRSTHYDFSISRDAWLIALCNCLTSVYAGFVVFGTLGMLASDQARINEKVLIRYPNKMSGK